MKILSRSATRRCCRISTNGSGHFALRRKPRPRDMAASPRFRVLTSHRREHDRTQPEGALKRWIRWRTWPRSSSGRRAQIVDRTDCQLLEQYLNALVRPDKRGSHCRRCVGPARAIVLLAPGKVTAHLITRTRCGMRRSGRTSVRRCRWASGSDTRPPGRERFQRGRPP